MPEFAWLHPDGRLDALSGDRILRYPNVDAVGHGEFQEVSKLESGAGLKAVHCAWSADGRRIAVPDLTQKRLRGWDVATGRLLCDAPFTQDNLLSGVPPRVDCSTDGSSMLFTSGPHSIVTQREQIAGWKATVWEPSGHAAVGLNAEGTEAVLLRDNQNGTATLQRTAPDDIRIIAERPVDFPPAQLRQNARLDVSPNGRHVLVGDRVLALDSGAVQWAGVEEASGAGQYGNEWGEFLTDDLILINNLNRFQVWNWPANRRELELLTFPDGSWACVDATGHYTSSLLAENFLQLQHRGPGGRTEWVSPAEYTRRTGWKPDASQVGLQVGGEAR